MLFHGLARYTSLDPDARSLTRWRVLHPILCRAINGLHLGVIGRGDSLVCLIDARQHIMEKRNESELIQCVVRSSCQLSVILEIR